MPMEMGAGARGVGSEGEMGNGSRTTRASSAYIPEPARRGTCRMASSWL